ncbi:CDP-diacylglycerol--glycerol-3-phosphate 3-phosphatidyltransferase [Chloroflexi bacterium TSY]|nr:CDP-diacylglycerol--glycerol-3-phosphate 3-phosphatidyltransferase [Chloroflexi bacterium TSY]
MVNWPNALTILRIGMAFATFWLVLEPSLISALVAGLIFTIAAITDLLDGQLARRTGAITTFGKILDPIADKILVLGTFAVLSYLDVFSFWIVLPILIREVAITAFRLYFLTKGTAVAAEKSGKQKTTVQIVAIGVIYANLLFVNHFFGTVSPATAQAISLILSIAMYLLLAAAVWLTIYSGYLFFRNNWRLIVG